MSRGGSVWVDASRRARQYSVSNCRGSQSPQSVRLGRARAAALGTRRRVRSWTSGAAARTGPTASILSLSSCNVVSKCSSGGPALSASRARTTLSSSSCWWSTKAIPGLGEGSGSGIGARARGSEGRRGFEAGRRLVRDRFDVGWRRQAAAVAKGAAGRRSKAENSPRADAALRVRARSGLPVVPWSYPPWRVWLARVGSAAVRDRGGGLVGFEAARERRGVAGLQVPGGAVGGTELRRCQ